MIKGVSSMAQDSAVQDSMTNDLFFHTRDFSRTFLRIVYSMKQFLWNMHIYRVNCVSGHSTHKICK